MKIAPVPHSWQVSAAQAKSIQADLARQVITEGNITSVRYIAGLDVGFDTHTHNQIMARAAIAVLRLPELALCDYVIHRQKVSFPYLPGLLSFRECPVILGALERLRVAPDLLLCDGQGIAHPRRFGIACHVGILTGIPSLGVAKSRLIGEHAQVPNRKGHWTPLLVKSEGTNSTVTDENETIGAVLRTRVDVKPLFISVGHKIDLNLALQMVMACVTRYRLPETTRWADGLASQRAQQWLLKGAKALDEGS